MRVSSTVVLCYGAMPQPDEASVRPTRDPPPGRRGDGAEAALLLARDRDRIAEDMNDLVVRRLFSAGLTLEIRSESVYGFDRNRCTETAGIRSSAP